MESSTLLIKKRRQPKTKLFMVIFIITVALVVANQVLVNIYSKQLQANSQHIADLGVLVQSIVRESASAIEGDGEALPVLLQARNEFANTWALFNNGAAGYISSGLGFSAALPGNAALVQQNFPELETSWNEIASDVDLIVSNESLIADIQLQSENLSSILPVVQREYIVATENLVAGNMPIGTIAAAQSQDWLAQRIIYNLALIATGRSTATFTGSFQDDIESFLANHQALLDGSSELGITRVVDGDVRDNLLNVSAMMPGIQGPANSLIAAMPDIEALTLADERIRENTAILSVQINQLGMVLPQTTGNQLASPVTGYGLLLVLLLTIATYGNQVLRQSQEAEQVSAEKNTKNNEAVLKLLSEISSLGEGDLTVKATVGTDFTGAIADSINYAVDQLRELVSAITSVTLEVTSSAESSLGTVESLSEASKRQNESITSVHDSIREIGDGINQVNESTRKTLDVAKNSVQTAVGGAKVVKDTIKGMGNIREQIQDTSKRIKRLGESSQEIGGFVSLINDIAEHTNTLSLNAAIQAATAGDAGKGFAVVADEVHALAERSADATRQIESLVKVIQTDIKEAVQSMEETTAEVVSGTKLATSAGTALDDIQKVSRELQELVDSINQASSNQTKAAVEITQYMSVIQEMTANTTSGVEETEKFMTNLGSLTERLQNAVAGFSLEESTKHKWTKNIPKKESKDSELSVNVDKDDKKDDSDESSPQVVSV